MITKTSIRTENATVACTPPPTLAIQGKTKDGFKTASQKTQLLELEVVFEGTFPMGARHLVSLHPGMKVYVNHENTVQEWMKRTFTLEGKEFILVPSQYVLMTRSQPWEEYTPEELTALVGQAGMIRKSDSLMAESRGTVGSGG